MVGDRQLEQELQLEEGILNRNLSCDEEDGVLRHIWNCGERQMAWDSEMIDVHPSNDTRSLSAVQLENRKFRVLFPFEKSVLFSKTQDAHGQSSDNRKARPFSNVSIAQPGRIPVRPATAYELSAIKKALSLGGSEITATSTRSSKPSVYITKQDDDESGTDDDYEGHRVEDHGSNRKNVDTLAAAEKNKNDYNKTDFVLFGDSGTNIYTRQNKNNSESRYKGKDHDKDCKSTYSTVRNNQLLDKCTKLNTGANGLQISDRNEMDKLMKNDRLYRNSDRACDERQDHHVNYTQVTNERLHKGMRNNAIRNSEYGSPYQGNCHSPCVIEKGNTFKDRNYGNQLLDNEPNSGTHGNQFAAGNIKPNLMNHEKQHTHKRKQKRVQIRYNNFVGFKRPESAPDALRYSHISKEQKPEKQKSALKKRESNYLGFIRQRTEKKISLFSREERPTLLDIHKEGIRLADYEGKVKEFSQKVVPLKVDEHHITDYYMSRMLEEQSRGIGKSECTLRFASRSPEIEGARINRLSKIPNLTFKGIDFDFNNRSSTLIDESVY